MACRADAGWGRACCALAALAAFATHAHAQGLRSPVPVALRARLDLRLVTQESSVPAWNIESRAPADSSRFMADLTAGDGGTGRLYFKGAASWDVADDALGRVDFRLEQGEYRIARRDSSRVAFEMVAFGDERVFFTGELGTPIVDDDDVERFEHRLGVRVDGARHDLGATYLAARIDEGPTSRIAQLGTVRLAARPALASISYLHNSPEQGDDHAIVKAEAAGYVGPASAVVSYEQSGFGSGMFVPSGSWDDFDPGYRSAAPENSATFAELRGNRVTLGDDGWVSGALRYELVGAEYVDDLASRRPGTVASEAWLDWSHRRYAVDARLALRDETRFELFDGSRRTLVMTAHALLRDNSSVLARGGLRRDEGDEREGFVHAGYGRALQGFAGRVDAMVDHIGRESAASAGVEGRVNWNATSAFYLRWVVRDTAPRAQAVFARIEFRPTRRTWLTLGYGRDVVGDGPYFLEDADEPPASDSDEVVTLTVRGDL